MTSGRRRCCDPKSGTEPGAEGHQPGEQVRDQTSLHVATLCLAPTKDKPFKPSWGKWRQAQRDERTGVWSRYKLATRAPRLLFRLVRDLVPLSPAGGDRA
jgi:hypothetical protein